MSFEQFSSIISALASKMGVRVSPIEEDGRYVAQFPDGPRFTANAVSSRFSVKWGSGHEKFASMAEVERAVSAL